MHWRVSEEINPEQKEELSSYSELTAQLLVNRNITSKQQARDFFASGLGALNNYNLLPNIKAAAEAVIAAVKRQQKIYIYGDYDVDGVCATSILFDFLYRKLGADVLPYIPSRFEEGYGMSRQGLDKILQEGGKLVITVDCGIRDAALIDEYVEKGLQFIVTDHHSLPERDNLPLSALAIVHPALPDSKYPVSAICGTTVAWKLVQKLAELALVQNLILRNLVPDEYLDLVALATVCDIMPLQNENRSLVKLGLKKLNRDPNPGLAQLIKIAELQGKEITVYHLGFVLGPRINAGGRISHAIDCVRLLTTKNQEKLFEIAAMLNRLNLERQKLTEAMLNEAEESIDIKVDTRLLFVSGKDWAEGVIGLVAGKLTEKYNLPSVAISIGKDGEAKGSARSIKNFNITEAISYSSELLIRYGGHAQAAGFTLETKNLQLLQDSLEDIAGRELKPKQLQRELVIDKALSLDEVDMETVKEINQFEPFGMGNPQPVFSLNGVTVKNIKQIGQDRSHVKLEILQKGNRIEAIAFNMAAEFAKVAAGDKIDIAGNLSADAWNGKERIQLKVRDFKNA